MIDHFKLWVEPKTQNDHFSERSFCWVLKSSLTKNTDFLIISEMFVVFHSNWYLKLYCWLFRVLFWFIAFRCSEKLQKHTRNSKSSHFLKQNTKCVLTSFSEHILSRTPKSGDHLAFFHQILRKTIILVNDHFTEFLKREEKQQKRSF